LRILVVFLKLIQGNR